MTFEQFIDKCLASITKKVPIDKLYFQYTYYPDLHSAGSSYKCQIKCTEYKIYVTPGGEINQYYNKDNKFVNNQSLDECLDMLLKDIGDTYSRPTNEEFK